MTEPGHLTNAELAEIRRNRPGVRASFACEGIYFTEEEEALFERLDRERLTGDQSVSHIIDYLQAKWPGEGLGR